jgi:probable rRNA maturation factor
MATILHITIQFRDARWKTILPQKAVREACQAGFRLQVSGLSKAKKKHRVTIVLANDALVRMLNRDFRGKDKPTNVLSFAETCNLQPETSLGDIILARQTILREAKEQGKTPRDHATHLLVHGMLHLMGYDHEREKEAATMEALEIKILKKLGINNPYL